MTSGILEGLNPEQAEAVSHVDGPMLVVAGAGSGKTRVVTRRIAYLIQQGIPAYQILALTFTNKAAREMAQRAEDLVGPISTLVTTFHSACARFLRYDIERFDCGRDRRFTIYDADDQQATVKACLKELNLDEKRFTPRSLRDGISRKKTEMVTWKEAQADAYGTQQEVLGKVYQRYESKLRAANAVDFDDLLWLTLQLWSTNIDVLREYQNRYRYLLVDEYQDTNRLQYLLLKALTGSRKNIHATGDPDQSIYSWRGADYSNIMDFQQDFESARIVMLNRNYRSTACILSATNQLIANNTTRYEKSLTTEDQGGEKIRLMHVPDDRAEAAWVSAEVRG
ncbi:MAG: ATP-dependent helicase, partial [Planctomycetota bacterium]